MTPTVGDNEAAVLGAILLTPPLIDRVINETGLQPAHFSPGRRRTIYQAMIALHDRGAGIDQLTIANEIGDRFTDIDRLEIDAVTAHTPVTGHATDYAAAVIEHARWRGRQDALARSQQAIDQRDENAWTAAITAADQAEPERGDILDGNALLHDFDQEWNTGGETTLTLPWTKLTDAMLGGARPGDSTLISGYSSHGKSLFAIAWLEHVADTDPDARVALYTNEMRPLELAARFVAGRVEPQIPFKTIMRGWFTDHQLADYRTALKTLPVNIIHVPGWPWADIARHLRRHKWDLACLDLFNRLPGVGQTSDEDEAINGLCNANAQAGGHLAVVAHLAKKRSMTGELDPPSGAEVRGSGMLFNTPANVIFVHQKQEQNAVGVWERTGSGIVWPDKIRNGVAGGRSGVQVFLNADRMRFEQDRSLSSVQEAA